MCWTSTWNFVLFSALEDRIARSWKSDEKDQPTYQKYTTSFWNLNLWVLTFQTRLQNNGYEWNEFLEAQDLLGKKNLQNSR